MSGNMTNFSIAFNLIIASFNFWQLVKILCWIFTVSAFLAIIFMRRSTIINISQKNLAKIPCKRSIQWFKNEFKKIKDKLYHLTPSSIAYNIFLMRVPIISGLILFLLPIVANFKIASRFLKNLFTMQSEMQIIGVMLCSTLTSTIIVSLSKTIFYKNCKKQNLVDDNKKKNKILSKFRTALILFILLPTWVVVYQNSLIEIGENNEASLALAQGFVISLVLIIVFSIFDYFSQEKSSTESKERINNLITKIESNRTIIITLEALVGFAFYGLVIYFNYPEKNRLSEYKEATAPALLYMLLLIWIFTLLLGGLTLYFDKDFVDQNSKSSSKRKYSLRSENKHPLRSKKKYPLCSKNKHPLRSENKHPLRSKKKYPLRSENKHPLRSKKKYPLRFPILISLIIFSGFSYWAFGVDHYFKLIPIQNKTEAIDYQEEFKMAIKKRLSDRDDEEKTLIVVAASGGGIQASGWTTQVLAGLQKELGESFTNAIGLISSTSGGSVGTMFYLDRLERGVLSQDGLEKVVENSTDDWLDSVGWGLAFPDLFRAIGLPFTSIFKQYRYLDRGSALEKDWQKSLHDPNTEITLEQWRKRILQGEIPIPVFNATLVEDGRRFLISPMKFFPKKLEEYIGDSNANKALDFRTLYENYDLNVTTAARLSASFPYVTPMARNDVELTHNYHVADGGFFDNTGLFTVVEWLDENLESFSQEFNVKKVLILQINAFPESQLEPKVKGKRGWFVVGLGALDTLNSVRDSTQQARNIEEVELLAKSWGNLEESDRVDIQHFVISFPEKDLKNNDYNPPLSWRLTKKEKHNLKDAWENNPTIRAEVDKIKAFWQS